MAPPGWLFGPVWTVLYALMGIAAWLVADKPYSASRTPLLLWTAQVALNATDPRVLTCSPWLALANIALLWLTIVGTAAAFFSRRPLAGVAHAVPGLVSSLRR